MNRNQLRMVNDKLEINGDVTTEGNYWDCECETNYIHLKKDRVVCPVCKAEEDDGQPDSRVNELKKENFYNNKIKWTPYLATAYAEGFCEGEGASEEDQISAWQYLIDTGLAWQLQGWFGRTAKSLIDQGIIKENK